MACLRHALRNFLPLLIFVNGLGLVSWPERWQGSSEYYEAHGEEGSGLDGMVDSSHSSLQPTEGMAKTRAWNS